MAEHPTDNREATCSNPVTWTKLSPHVRRVGPEGGRCWDVPLGVLALQDIPARSRHMCPDSSASGEQRSYKPKVGGSIPSLGTITGGRSVADCQPSKLGVLGSNPSRRSNEERASSSMWLEHPPYKRKVGEFESPLAYQPLIPGLSVSSSADKSSGLLSRVSRVQILPGGPSGLPRRRRGAGNSMVEYLAFNQGVESSSLSRPTSREKKRARSSMVEQAALNRQVQGSSPCEPTKLCEGKGRSPMVGNRSPKPAMLVRAQPGPPSPSWRWDAGVAQLVERLPCKQRVAGSIPVSGPSSTTTYSGGVAQLGEHLPCKQKVTGSIPVSSTKTRMQSAADKALAQHNLGWVACG